MATPLIIGDEQTAALVALRELAASKPLDMPAIVKLIETRRGRRQHFKTMAELTIEIPVGFTVTFSIERGHPCGTCRHMSMASPIAGRLPTLEALWMVAGELGFVGDLAGCAIWTEPLSTGEAVNVVQPLAMQADGGRV